MFYKLYPIKYIKIWLNIDSNNDVIWVYNKFFFWILYEKCFKNLVLNYQTLGIQLTCCEFIKTKYMANCHNFDEFKMLIKKLSLFTYFKYFLIARIKTLRNLVLNFQTFVLKTNILSYI